MNKRYYLAYGSNLNVRQMLRRCPNARIIGTGELKDYQLLFKGSKSGSYLTIEPKKGSVVPVGVWEVQADDEQSLDIYEGYPTFYYKKETELKVKGIRSGRIRTLPAFVYIMHEDRPLGTPSGHYLKVCYDGYLNFGFDPKYLFDAYAISQKENSVWKKTV